jgi:hypothetical protein
MDRPEDGSPGLREGPPVTIAIIGANQAEGAALRTGLQRLYGGWAEEAEGYFAHGIAPRPQVMPSSSNCSSV